MGFHSVGAKEAIGPNCPPTTVMTSTLINVASHGSNAAIYFFAFKGVCRLPAPVSTDPARTAEEQQSETEPFRELYEQAASKFLAGFKPLAAFTLGALFGSATMYFGSFWCLSSPVAIVVFLICDAAFGVDDPPANVRT
eukprot:gnl/Spiro4/13417_TR7157_c0_g2_i1.p1 gnl/Spiro4/13417_TR7157_c0_g2~~gnl/Spiro4/13417_TR7157_c0_g2_i1.p1  ORF type:complete len:139 (-),score=19.13 gnl/Spiro4/13417_TR7157_c0_g2_i1:31-447(-)